MIQGASDRPLSALRCRNRKEKHMAEEKTVERHEKDLDCIELDFDVTPTAEELAEAEKDAGGEE